MTNILNRNTPPYYFAVTEEVRAHCPFSFKEKDKSVQLTADHFLPTQANPTDSGWDVRCAMPEGMILKPGCSFKMKLGFRAFCPEGWYISLHPRSGTYINKNIDGHIGIVDCQFEGELTFLGRYFPNACDLIPGGQDFFVPFGERIAQIVPTPRWEMNNSSTNNEELDRLFALRKGSRGTGGYGSTGIV